MVYEETLEIKVHRLMFNALDYAQEKGQLIGIAEKRVVTTRVNHVRYLLREYHEDKNIEHANNIYLEYLSKINKLVKNVI